MIFYNFIKIKFKNKVLLSKALYAMSQQSTQQLSKKVSKDVLIDITEYNTKNIIFSDAIETKIPNSTITNRRIYIKSKNPDGSVGNLYLQLPQLFSFGVSETRNMQDPNKIDGYTVSHVLRSKDGATPEEVKCESVLRDIVKKCVSNVNEQFKNKLLPSKWKETIDVKLKKLENKILYQKLDDDGNVVDNGSSPTFSVKLVDTKPKKDPKTGAVSALKIETTFYHNEEVDSNGEPLELNPLDYLSSKELKKYFKTTSVIKIEDVFVASDKCTITIKLSEAEIEPVGNKMPKLLNKRRTFNRPSDDDDKTNKLLSTNVEEIETSLNETTLESDNEEEVKTPPKKEKSKKKKVESDNEEEVEVKTPPKKVKKSKKKKVESDEDDS